MGLGRGGWWLCGLLRALGGEKKDIPMGDGFTTRFDDDVLSEASLIANCLWHCPLTTWEHLHTTVGSVHDKIVVCW